MLRSDDTIYREVRHEVRSVILHGDLFDVLPTLAAESFDACVTDPPYGIGFMGREWDTFKPDAEKFAAMSEGRNQRMRDYRGIVSDNPNINGRHRSPAVSPSQIEYDYSAKGLRSFQDWTERWAGEVLRVLKPGAYLLVCGAPRSFHRMTCGVEDAGFVIRDCFSWLYGQGFPKSLNLGDGRGTALKPGWEPIIVARKPFKGSLVANVETYGTGALNIDACRIDTESRPLRESARRSGNVVYGDGLHGSRAVGDTDLGRWPANVLLDEDAAAMLDEQTGDLHSGGFPQTRNTDKFRSVYGDFKGGEVNPHGIGASVGGPSRFFYVAKPSREERDLGTFGLTEHARDESRKAGNPGGDNPRNRGLQPRGNFHPTVKPLALMRWLVRLVTPPGGRVLDPFGGSGTTGMACAAENIAFTLIEREAEYIPIIEARIRAIAPLFQETA